MRGGKQNHGTFSWNQQKLPLITTMPSVILYNLGCSKNIIDGERIVHLIEQAGYSITESPTHADIIIVNTCAFIREAQEEAIETIFNAAAHKKSSARIIVSGCFSERFRKNVASRFPEVDVWVGVNDWEQLLAGQFNTDPHSFKRTLSEPFSTQYIKIADGCSHGCSFCVIPSIRGPYKSREWHSIKQELAWLEAYGTHELILVAQDSSFYGHDSNSSLKRLLEHILAACAIPWIRVMYLHPNYIDTSLLSLFASEKRLCSYFDVPLQHISEPILRSMRRTPLKNGIISLIEHIRSTVPDATIRSSFITGYPGETEKMFKELLSFIEWARFDRLGVFPFSPEEGTPAEKMRPRPRNGTALRRCETIMLAQREISRERNEQYIGSCCEVIIDAIAENPDFNFEARTRADAPEVDGKVLIRNGTMDIGSIRHVTIIGADDYDLYAEITEE